MFEPLVGFSKYLLIKLYATTLSDFSRLSFIRFFLSLHDSKFVEEIDERETEVRKALLR